MRKMSRGKAGRQEATETRKHQIISMIYDVFRWKVFQFFAIVFVGFYYFFLKKTKRSKSSTKKLYIIFTAELTKRARRGSGNF